jgi:hypothetical protein
MRRNKHKFVCPIYSSCSLICYTRPRLKLSFNKLETEKGLCPVKGCSKGLTAAQLEPIRNELERIEEEIKIREVLSKLDGKRA